MIDDKTPPSAPKQPITVAPEGKGFFVFHTALMWDVAGPFHYRHEAFIEVKKRKKETGLASWAVQIKPLKRRKDKRDPVLMGIVIQVAGMLGETKKAPIETLMNIIEVCGVAFVESVYKDTMEIEAMGGLSVEDPRNTSGRTKRTRGGIFFRLARQRMTMEQRGQIVRWKQGWDGYLYWIAQQAKAREAEQAGGLQAPTLDEQQAAGVQQAMEDTRPGIPDEKMAPWMESLGTDKPRPMPEPPPGEKKRSES